MKLETVKIKGDNGQEVVINKADFDAKKHTLAGEKQAKPVTKPVKKGKK